MTRADQETSSAGAPRCDACGRGTLETVRRPRRHPGALRRALGRRRRRPPPARSGEIVLAACPDCAYVRNVAFDPASWSTTPRWTPTCTTRRRSRRSRPSSSGTSPSGTSWRPAGARHRLRAGRVPARAVPRGRAARGVGYDAMYAGTVGADPSGATFHSGYAPRGRRRCRSSTSSPRGTGSSTSTIRTTSSADLREQAGDRPVHGYIEVPDAGYDLSTAGWEVIYPHVSYFDAFSLAQHRRAGRLAGRGQRHAVRRHVPLHRGLGQPATGPRRGSEPLPDAGRPRPSAGARSPGSPHAHHGRARRPGGTGSAS